MGLDLFAAAMGESIEATANAGGFELFARWRVALSGVLMGLGSSPTHEIIRYIQESKIARRGENAPKPSIDPGPFPADASMRTMTEGRSLRGVTVLSLSTPSHTNGG